MQVNLKATQSTANASVNALTPSVFYLKIIGLLGASVA